MLKNLDNLGEQTINKIAAIAFAKQMKHVEELSVNVKIDPQQLSKGVLTSLMIDGKGLVTSSNLKAAHLSLFLEDVGVYPFKALVGNIQLTKPALGNALIKLKAQDIAETLQVFLSEENLQPVTIKQINCELESPDEIMLNVAIYNTDQDSLSTLEVAYKIAYDPTQEQVICKASNYYRDHEFQDTLGHLLQRMLLRIFNFQFLIFDGISFKVEDLTITDDALELKAIAKITSFPKNT